jgi:hypothetical protein
MLGEQGEQESSRNGDNEGVLLKTLSGTYYCMLYIGGDERGMPESGPGAGKT